MIYLDNAATTSVDASLKPIINEYLYESFGNPGSPHPMGHVAKVAVESAREKIKESLLVPDADVIFTSGGSEANTLATVGLAPYLLSKGKTHIITDKYEHKSVLNAMRKMEDMGFEVTYLDIHGGIVYEEAVAAAIKENTGLISVMSVNNEIGSLNPTPQISALCKGNGILMHTDCVQAIGSVPLESWCVGDFVTISGHKIHAPKGVGALITPHEELLSNVICGGQQEYGLRPGTENVAGIAALGERVLRSVTDFDLLDGERVRTAFVKMLLRRLKPKGIELHINTPREHSPRILSLRFDDVDAPTLTLLLGEMGVCVSTGSACTSSSVVPSHVLKAIGLTDKEARETIRVSFDGYYESSVPNGVLKAAKIIADAVCRLKEIHKNEEGC